MGKASKKKQSSPKANAVMVSAADGSSADRAVGQGKSSDSLFSRVTVHLLLIGILGFLVYSNTFHSPFQWDEGEYIVQNPFVKDLSFFAAPSRAGGMFDNALKSRYVGFLTFALNYRMHGFDVFGYHVVNLAIHLINAALVYLLVMLTFRTPHFMATGAGQEAKAEGEKGNQARHAPMHHPGVSYPSLFDTHFSRFFAFAVALLFVAHPVQTEAVTYIFQRFASLAAMFYLLSLVTYVYGRLAKWQVGKLTSYVFSLAFAVCAMKTKENAFTLPVMIALYEFLFFSGPFKSRILRLIPFGLTMLIIPVMFVGAEGKAGEIISQIKDPASLGFREIARADYLLTQFRVIITYLRLLVLPINQNIDYDYPLYHSLFSPQVLSSFLFLTGLFGSGVYLAYKSRGHSAETMSRKGVNTASPDYPVLSTTYLRLMGFGILWFFITISVESSIIPIPMVIAEYRIYLPSVGFFLSVVTGVLLLFERFVPNPVRQRYIKAGAVVFGLILLSLAAATHARNELWKDKVTLWEDVVRKSPNSPRAYDILGIAYYEKGAYDKAIGMYEHVIALLPYFRNAHVNLGVAYASTGRLDNAIEEFRMALAIDPKNNVAYANLARAYSETKQYGAAVDNYLKSIELNPYDSKAYHGLGTAYVSLGRLDEALAAYTKFVELSPREPEAYRNRGNVFAFKGDLGSAAADFRKACALGSQQSCRNLQDPRFR